MKNVSAKFRIDRLETMLRIMANANTATPAEQCEHILREMRHRNSSWALTHTFACTVYSLCALIGSTENNANMRTISMLTIAAIGHALLYVAGRQTVYDRWDQHDWHAIENIGLPTLELRDIVSLDEYGRMQEALLSMQDRE